jgi:pilus assembly protein Flp/PilA
MVIVRRLWADNRGVGAIEYALVASLISVAALAAFQSLGGQVQTKYSSIDQALSGAL